MRDAILKCTTRHVRIFTARLKEDQLVADSEHLTLDLDPDNEFIWDEKAISEVQASFTELVSAQAGKELSDYSLRRIGSELEGKIRRLLQKGLLSYNPDCRVMNYSMGLPRTPELL